MYLQLDQAFFENLLSEAKKSPRKRSHFNLHKSETEPVQRFCVGLIKGTYVRPHYHQSPNKWELLIVLKGTIELIIFNDEGVILKKLRLNQADAISGIEIEPNTWHSVFPVSDNAIFLEVKEGPYQPSTKNDFASWSPHEGESEVQEFQAWIESAKEGEKYEG